MRIYVAAPYGSAARVREVHKLLEAIDCSPVSHWAEMATDAEHLTDSAARVQRAMWEVNIQCLDTAEAVLVLSEETGGGEMFAEIGRALHMGRPVLWTGPRRVLSCYAPGVVIERCLDDALDRLAGAAKAPREHRRDYMLAGFRGVTCPRCRADDARSAQFADGSPAWNCRHCGAMFARLSVVA